MNLMALYRDKMLLTMEICKKNNTTGTQPMIKAKKKNSFTNVENNLCILNFFHIHMLSTTPLKILTGRCRKPLSDERSYVQSQNEQQQQKRIFFQTILLTLISLINLNLFIFFLFISSLLMNENLNFTKYAVRTH